jgi:hypothetical protein
MNNNYFSMRNLAAFTLLLFGTIASTLAATPPGKVTSVNPGTHTFKAQWIVPTTRHHFVGGHETGSVEKTFKTTDKTTYLVGSAKGSWSDITKGAQVNILAAHNEGSVRVVDKVQIVPGS